MPSISKVRSHSGAGLALLLALPGCHLEVSSLEYQPRAKELNALAAASETFGRRVELGDHPAIAGELDLPARKALLIFAASLAYEKNLAIKKAADLAIAGLVMAAVFMLVSGEAEPWRGLAQGALEASSRRIALALQEEFGLDAKQLFGAQVSSAALLSHLEGLRTPDEGPTREKVLAALGATKRTGCHSAGRLVSYQLGLLRFTSWEHADRSRAFVDWKRRARSLHLTQVFCAEARAFVLLATEDDHPEPRVVFFRFLPPEQFDKAKLTISGWIH